MSRTRCSALGAAPQSRDPSRRIGPGSAAHRYRAAPRPGHECRDVAPLSLCSNPVTLMARRREAPSRTTRPRSRPLPYFETPASRSPQDEVGGCGAQGRLARRVGQGRLRRAHRFSRAIRMGTLRCAHPTMPGREPVNSECAGRHPLWCTLRTQTESCGTSEKCQKRSFGRLVRTAHRLFGQPRFPKTLNE